MTTLLITGSRDWNDLSYLREVLARFDAEHDNITLISGACPNGADRMCEEVAEELGWAVNLHPAQWDKYGRRAGFVRNADMVNLNPDFCIAFVRNRSKGAMGTVRLSIKAKLRTEVHHYNDFKFDQGCSYEKYNFPDEGVLPKDELHVDTLF